MVELGQAGFTENSIKGDDIKPLGAQRVLRVTAVGLEKSGFEGRYAPNRDGAPAMTRIDSIPTSQLSPEPPPSTPAAVTTGVKPH